ncbi:putative sodium-coupled neutral amino acid transporter 10 [Maniola hyperantus]|uniref:putative sodium-coupled neutral amino acid transporter 10 n=1 Tax=Aphantopus hyperantus TaxID=2795564 RepID=UPI00156A707C|nr:putative sodium-coupled neutral amino acid transporter 10 [Maniola hyperantus]
MGTTGQSITLANSIIGVGILAMPFCFQQCGVLLATLILLSMGLISRLCCYFLLKSAIITRRRNYEFLAFHIFGPAGKMAVEMGIIGFLMGTCIAYFVVVGDLGPQIIAKMFNINQSDILRTSIMVIVSLLCVLPLGLLRNVDSLSNVSAATIAFYLCLVIKVIVEATGQLFTSDWTSRIELWKPSGVLQCVPIFSMALFCQAQLFEIFESLPSLSLEKMCVVTKNAINICSSVYFTLGIFGYIAFGSQEISGNILMSLSPTMASDVIKLGFVMSLACSFPLIIFPCRASLYSFLYRKGHPTHHDHMAPHSIPEGPFRLLTLGIISCALCVSLLLPNIELVLGLLGATIGVLICLVFPAAAFLNVTFKNTNERVLAKFIVVLGLIILILGTYANLQAAENSREKYDEKYITQERIDKIVEDFFQKREKSEEVMVKPQLENSPVLQKDVKELVKPVIKDSEVQPPNPVPPESHSNEKLPVIYPVHEQKDIVPNVDVKDSISHPKNVISKINGEKLVNGVSKSDVEDKIAIPDKIEQPKKETAQANQQKLDMMKQQQLIETIKQHGQEQKELIKEQKEILTEIQKAKKEFQQNKKEIGSIEAKKIAVESIQKIANVAIQSLSGVTDKPLDVKPEKEPVGNIANEAVNDIAQKAQETLDAIREIDKKKNEQLEKEKIANNQVINNVPQLPLKDNAVPLNNVPIPNTDHENIKQNVNTNLDKQSIKREVPDNNKLEINNLQQKPKEEPKIQPKSIELNGNNLEVPIKSHSHLPDEPKSYQQGEDTQINENPELKPNNDNVQNVPVVKTEHEEDINKNEPIKSKENGAIKFKADDILGNIANGNVVPRRKREVVDCTKETTLKPEDKQICENLVNVPDNRKTQEVFLPNVNLADVGLSDTFQAIASHHMRSLKSIQEDEKR